jgi:hypothetical protein
VATWPLAARAQQGDRVRRIGVLMAGDEIRYSAFTQALADLGWTDGRNVRTDVRWADINRMRALAQELVGLQPDITGDLYMGDRPLIQSERAQAHGRMGAAAAVLRSEPRPPAGDRRPIRRRAQDFL